MKWPEDWDKPSEGNDLLCKKFSAGSWKGVGGFTLKYRLLNPEKDDKKAGGIYPLALYLHGADAFGNDNMQQLEIHDIGTMLAREEWQKENPCYVLAPQCRMDQHWSRNDVGEQLQHFVEYIIASHDDIDRSRVYLYGYSAGGIGVLNLLKRYSDFYAGAIPICGAVSGEDILSLLKTPIWLVHAEDDRIVRASYGNPGDGSKFYLGSTDIYEVLKKNQSGDNDIRYTGYPPGWMKKIFGVNPHCSWVAVSDAKQGDAIRRWLFSKKRIK